MKPWLEEVVLETESLRLLPLRESHKEALIAAASDGELWKLWFTGVPSKESVDQYIAQALADHALGLALAFVVEDKQSGAIIGSSRFCNAVAPHRRVEIGYTWYAKSFQRSKVNTQCKLLMLQHAFDELQAIAVEFRTHWHNQASRTAIARLGAKQDGVLRNHSIEADGAYRDTVVFSILESEWPSVAKNLRFQLERARL
ncbi:MAG: GNAT family N-acetyltransferase [Gammaproteobacteria bacterium]